MSHPHLSDDQLVEMHYALDPSDGERAHLLGCTACESRRARLAQALADVDETVTLEADQAFPADRLSRQRTRILQRIEAVGRSARVIAFPAGHTHASPGPMRRPARWAAVAAAVAASFVVGILAGHLSHDLPGSRQSTPAPRMARQTTPPSGTIRAALSDDELLGQVELAAGRVGPAALRPLDALTPRPWDGR
jgi:hypothetical protein